MPYTLVHTELAFELENILGYSEEEFQDFLVGNIFVDANYLLQKKNYPIKRSMTHYYEGKLYEEFDFVNEFLEQEGLKSHFLLGYYFHLLTDEVWKNSPLVAEAYKSREKEKLYQISRKFYAFYDLQKMYDIPLYMEKIEKLRTYAFNKGKIPNIFSSIPRDDLNVVLNGMIDFMIGKELFFKESEDESDYIIRDGKLHIHDKNLERLVLTSFPYEEYAKLKKEALNKFQSQMLSKIY